MRRVALIDYGKLELQDDWGGIGLQPGTVKVEVSACAVCGSDLALYEVGRRALTEGGVIEAYTMTPETAVVKLMWILARERNVEAVRRRFYEPVAHDLLTLKNPEIG